MRTTKAQETERADKAERSADLYRAAFEILSGKSAMKMHDADRDRDLSATLYVGPRAMRGIVIFENEDHVWAVWADDLRPDEQSSGSPAFYLQWRMRDAWHAAQRSAA